MERAAIEDLIIAERARLAAVLPELTEAEWATPSLCDGWTSREVVGHLVVAMAADRLRFLGGFVRAAGNFDRATDRHARVEAARSNADLIAEYGRVSGRINPPPFLGAAAPLTDVVIHTQDLAIPLGRTITPDPAAVIAALDFRTSNRLASSFGGSIPQDTCLVATDLDWQHTTGTGATTVEAAGLDLLLQLSGRTGLGATR